MKKSEFTRTETGVINLQAEYESYVAESTNNNEVDLDKLTHLLQSEGDWTCEGAKALIDLSRQYGSFMLKNALALAMALNIEDGELGF